MKNKIAIITLNYPLGVLSDINSMAESFAEAGFLVDIFIDQYMFNAAKIDFKNENIKIITIAAENKFVSYLWQKRFLGVSFGGIYKFCNDIITKFKIFWLKKYFNYINNSKPLSGKIFYYQKHFFIKEHRFSKELKKYDDENYVCVVGVEPYSLISAFYAFGNKKTPIIYHNMELFLSSECNSKLKNILKGLERECSSLCAFVIIQDKARAKYLIEDNNLNASKIKYLPVSSKEEIYTIKSDYLYKKLGIPISKEIVLYAGNIAPSTMVLEIAQSVKKWPENCVLVLHGWNRLSLRDKYIKEIIKLVDDKHIYLSADRVGFEELPKLLSSAKIGLLFYRNLGPNFYEIGSSCNKLVQYLRVGLPIIAIDFPSLKEKIDKSECGICVESPELIGCAIAKIMLNYKNYSQNAMNLYEKDYNFSKNFISILEDIKHGNF